MSSNVGQPQAFQTEGQDCYGETHQIAKNRVECMFLTSGRYKDEKEKRRDSDIHAQFLLLNL